MTTTPIQMRFADVDMLGHVNNVNQQHYFDVGKSDFFAQVLDPAPNWKQEGLITVSTYNDYLAQIRYGEPIAVLTRIEKVGNKSFTLFQQIVNTATQEVKTQSRSVLVCFSISWPKYPFRC
ncbi:MAG: acyl-CoA thioesterase [Alistipes indistinctus]